MHAQNISRIISSFNKNSSAQIRKKIPAHSKQLNRTPLLNIMQVHSIWCWFEKPQVAVFTSSIKGSGWFIGGVNNPLLSGVSERKTPRINKMINKYTENTLTEEMKFTYQTRGSRPMFIYTKAQLFIWWISAQCSDQVRDVRSMRWFLPDENVTWVSHLRVIFDWLGWPEAY